MSAVIRRANWSKRTNGSTAGSGIPLNADTLTGLAECERSLGIA